MDLTTRPEMNPLLVSVDMNTPAGQAWARNHTSDLQGPVSTMRRYACVEVDSGVAENADVHYATISALGRPESFKSFVGIENRVVSLRVFIRPDEGTSNYIQDIVEPALWLEALKYPTVDTYAGGDSVPSYAPPPVFFVLGSILRMRAVVTHCAVLWQGPWTPSADVNATGSALTPSGAEVQITFTQVSTFNDAGDYNFRMSPHRLGAYKGP